MTKKEMIRRTRKALEELNKLPDEEQIRRLVEYGTINEKGEVLLGGTEGERNGVAEQDNGLARE
jgi:hypothetical protein